MALPFLASEVTLHLFHCILWVANKSLRPLDARGERWVQNPSLEGRVAATLQQSVLDRMWAASVFGVRPS